MLASKKTENARLALLTDEDLTTILSSAEAKGTKKNTKWTVGTIEGKYIFKKGKVITSFQMNVQFETVLKILLFYIVYIALAEWRRERRLPSNLLTMTFESLDNVLRRLYAEARTKKGEERSPTKCLSVS